MVTKPLIRLYFEGGTLGGGGRLTSHEPMPWIAWDAASSLIFFIISLDQLLQPLDFRTMNRCRSIIILHQHVQVPKKEVLNHIRLFWWWVFPYIGLAYSLYR